MKRFKIAFESQEVEPKEICINESLKEKALLLREIRIKSKKLSTEGFLDWFKKKTDPKPSSNMQDSTDKKYEEPSIQEFEEKLKTATSISVHLDCDTIQNQIKYLEAYKSKLIPFLYKDIERLRKCFEFIKTKKRSFIDHIDELVDIGFPDKMPGYNASKNACVFPEFVINVTTTKEKLKKKNPDFEFEDGFDDEYPEITDETEQNNIVKFHSWNTWIVEFSFLILTHPRNKEQDKITLSLDDPLAKKYIQLSLEICKEMKKVAKDFDSLIELGYSVEKALAIKDYGDGDEFGIGEMTVHGFDLIQEVYIFENGLLSNCKLK